MEDKQKPYEIKGQRPGDRTVRIQRRTHRRRLRVVPNIPGVLRFLWDIVSETPFVPLLLVLTGIWLLAISEMGHFSNRTL